MAFFLKSKSLELHEENDVLLLLHSMMQKTLYLNDIPKKKILHKELNGSNYNHKPSKIKENEKIAKKIVPQYLHHINNFNNLNINKNKIIKDLKSYKSDLQRISNKLHYQIQKTDLLLL